MIKNKVNKISKDIILINVAITLLGVFLVLNPWGAKEIICRIIGGILTAWGIFKVFDSFVTRGNKTVNTARLIFGCILTGIGVYILVLPGFLAAMLTVLLSIILFIGALFKLQYALNFAKNGSKLRWVQAGAAILLLITSVIAFLNPFGNAGNLIMIFIGAALIVDGIWDLLTILYIKKKLSQRIDEADIPGVQNYETDNSGKYVNTTAEDSDSSNS